MLTTLGYQQREFPAGNKKEIYPKISAYWYPGSQIHLCKEAAPPAATLLRPLGGGSIFERMDDRFGNLELKLDPGSGPQLYTFFSPLF